VIPAKEHPALLKVMIFGPVVLAAVAFAGSFTHVEATVAQHGQTGWIAWAIAAMPELMVLLCVASVRVGRASPWTWVMGASAVAFTLGANLAQAQASPWGLINAGFPAWAALCSVTLLHGPGATRKPEASRRQVKAQASPPPAAQEAPAAAPEASPGLHSVAPPVTPSGAKDSVIGVWVSARQAEGLEQHEVIRRAEQEGICSRRTVQRHWAPEEKKAAS